MNRRVIHVILLLAGLIPLVWAVCVIGDDPRRGTVLILMATIGVILNALAVGERQIALTVPLRVIAAGVSLVVLAAIMLTWNRERLQLPTVEPELVEPMKAGMRNLLWMAGTMIYLLASLLFMPRAWYEQKRKSTKPGEPIDFHTLGR